MKPIPRILFLLVFFASTCVAAQTPTFTYQGQLRDAGQPFTGIADLEFRLYDQLTGGSQIGGPQARGQWPVEDGLFQVELNFGAAAFDGSDRFLEVTVNGAPLSPRQKITATPYALLATGLASGSVGGGSVDPSEVQLRVDGSCPPGQYIAQVLQSGDVVCEVDQDSGSSAWRLGGNAGLSAGAYLGTSDATPMNIRVDGKRAMRYEWGFSSSGAPNIIGGVDANSIPDTDEASVIAGGGLAGAPNSIVGNGSAIGGGIGNTIDGSWSVIPGGRSNQVNGNDSVALGRSAQANHDNVFVWNDGGSFASTGPDQFLIDAGGGVGIGTNSPSDQLHISIPSGDAMRVQIGGQTRFRIHDNGGISVGVNSGPPADGLLVNGDIRYAQARTQSLNVSAYAFHRSSGNPAQQNWSFLGNTALRISPFVGCTIGQAFGAPIQLPQGAVVREVHALMRDQDPNNNLRVLVRGLDDADPGSNLTLANFTSSGSADSYRTFSDTTIGNDTIDNASTAYSISLLAGCGGPYDVASVRIVYEIRDLPGSG